MRLAGSPLSTRWSPPKSEAQLPGDPDRRPALRRVRGRRASVHEDAEHRPHRVRGRPVRARFPHHSDLLAQPGIDRHGSIRESSRHHRQRCARRDESPAAELPPAVAEAGLRDRAYRQVAHGQQRHAASRLRLLGELRWSRPTERPEAQPRRQVRAAPRLHHRHHERPRRRVRREETQQAVLVVLRAQGCSSGCRPGSRRRHRPGAIRVATRRGTAQGPLPGKRVSPDSQHAVPRGGAETETRLGRSIQAQGIGGDARSSTRSMPATRRSGYAPR